MLIRFEPKQYVKNAGLSESDQQLLLRELYGSIDWVRLDRGTLTEAEVIDRCVSRVGEHLRGAVEKLVGHWDRPELPVEGMKALTDELYEKGYGLYLLTNAGPRQREYWPRFQAGEHFPEERVYRSADVHLLKPDPAFFEGALEKFGLDRAECVFIDDSAANAEGAQRVGARRHRLLRRRRPSAQRIARARRGCKRIKERCGSCGSRIFLGTVGAPLDQPCGCPAPVRRAKSICGKRSCLP